jgi:hypothetical protein
MLIILDLTERSYDRSLDTISVETLTQENDVERKIVVALVAGKRETPSERGRRRTG